MMEVGEFVEAKRFVEIRRGKEYAITARFAAKKNEAMVFIYMGMVSTKEPPNEEVMRERLGRLGWKQMTDEEYEVFATAKKEPKLV